MNRLALPYHLLFAACLTGCASGPQMPDKVLVPVPTPCLPKTGLPALPREPYTDPELAKLDDFKLVLALRADNLVLRTYTTELVAVLKACQ